MTNIKPITPFCVDMSEATENEIRELHKMCVDAGARDYESAWSWLNGRWGYSYMGVDVEGDITALDVTTDYQDNLITLDQVSYHLGLTSPEDKTLVHTPIQTSVTLPVTGFTTKSNESHTECVKRPVWTPTCFKEGIQYQEGMQVGLSDDALYDGHNITVTAIGNSHVLVDIDGEEQCVSKLDIVPYEEVVLSQRDKVMSYLEQEFDEEDSSIIYNEILKLGVFKDDK